MTDNVIPLGGITKLDIPAARVLDAAKVWADDGVVVIGWDSAGNLSFASSITDGGEVLWLLEQAKKQLLEINTTEGAI